MDKKYIATRLWLYDASKENEAYKGTDYSEYVMGGDQYTEDITDEIDTANITLIGLSRATPFDPETKFIYEKVQIREFEQEDETLGTQVVTEETTTEHHDVCVQLDTVTKVTLADDTFYNHTIAFCEPSVVAQKRVVDNMSATYKLQDVSLQEKTSVDEEAESQKIFVFNKQVPDEEFGYYRAWLLGKQRYFGGKYFDIGDVKWKIKNSQDEYSKKFYIKTTSSANVLQLEIPRIEIYNGVVETKNFESIGHATTDCIITEYDLQGNKTNEQTFVIKSNDLQQQQDEIGIEFTGTNDIAITDVPIPQGWLAEKFDSPSNKQEIYKAKKVYCRKYADTESTSNIVELTVQPNRKYSIKVTLHNYAGVEIPQNQAPKDYLETYSGLPTTLHYITKKGTAVPYDFFVWKAYSFETAEQNYTSVTEFQTYADGDFTTILTSGVPYSAYTLLQKAILNTGTIVKVKDEYTDEPVKVYDTVTAFYIDEKYVSKLKQTQVVENFYNQKNLWEICLEVGKYIHAVPRLEFGTDDRFKITFDELGSADEKESKTTVASVMNFRGVEDYISACSSYITNMVQLDGQITEQLVPKSTNEEYIVSNDDACLLTNKKLLEIVRMQVTNRKSLTLNGGAGRKTFSVGTTRDLFVPQDMTPAEKVEVTENTPALKTNPSGFVFEENVYKTLDNGYVNTPNKGLAMYYTLGTNAIKGWDYRTPTSSSGDRQNDYAIKKILYYLYYGSIANSTEGTNYWAGIKVNDFVFTITYRTKDSLRQEQCRPDLRKYLVNSFYDRVPTHQQFNNQQDVVVDSIKFGNNIYGKLIRTGNTEYQTTEWCEDLADCKHRGELYRINENTNTFDSDGNLYYVTKVEHTYYADCIVSVITYSKDYNQLSKVIGIPSEPRFYEISEQSSINREYVISDYYMLTDADDERRTGSDNFLNTTINAWGTVNPLGELTKLIWTDADYPEYVICTFKDDSDAYDDPLQGGQRGFHKDIMLPISAYSSENTLTFEWDCVDNFSAGDKVEEVADSEQVETTDGAYKTLKPVQYTDTFGRAQLFDFYIYSKEAFSGGTYTPKLTAEQVQALPESPFTTQLQDSQSATVYEIWSGTKEYIKNETIPTVVALVKDGVKYLLIKSAPLGISPIERDEDDGRKYWQPCKPYIRSQRERTICFTNDKRNPDGPPYEPPDYPTNNNDWGLVLLKDNREVISCNFNIQLLTSSDRFVLSPYLFKNNKRNAKLVLLKNEVNKMSSGWLDNFADSIIVPRNAQGQAMSPYFDFWVDQKTGADYLYENYFYSYDIEQVNAGHFNGTDGYEQVKAVALVYDIPNTEESFIPSQAKFIFAKNYTPELGEIGYVSRYLFKIQTINSESWFTNYQGGR